MQNFADLREHTVAPILMGEGFHFFKVLGINRRERRFSVLACGDISGDFDVIDPVQAQASGICNECPEKKFCVLGYLRPFMFLGAISAARAWLS